jgi:hypothetical protein
MQETFQELQIFLLEATGLYHAPLELTALVGWVNQ